MFMTIGRYRKLIFTEYLLCRRHLLWVCVHWFIYLYCNPMPKVMLFHFTSEGTKAWRASTIYLKPHSKSRVRIWNHVQSLFNFSTVFCRIFSANPVPWETELVGKHHPLLSLPNTHLPTHFNSCHLIIEWIQFILWSNYFRSPQMRSGSPGCLGSFLVGCHLLRSLWFPWSLSSTCRETAGKIRLG